MTSYALLSAAAVREAMGDLGDVEAVRGNRVRVRAPPGRIREALRIAQDLLACDHLVQIATVDVGETFEIHYHLTGSHRAVLSIRADVPRADPRIASVHDLLPPAGIYERQIHDLFGIRFEGHPDLRRIILNEDWPEGEHPLRKDWKMDPGKAYGGVPLEGT